MSAVGKTKGGRRLAIKLTRKRIIALLLLILGIFIFLESNTLDSELVTTLTFEASSTGEAPSVAISPCHLGLLAGHRAALHHQRRAQSL